MNRPASILLPGLHGTAELFKPFVAAAPPGLAVHALDLPNDRPRAYDELAQWVLTQLPAGPVALIAESFSGPLAILVADRCSRVRAVVLCSSFVEPPLPRLLARTPGFVLHRTPPIALLAYFLAGGDRALATAIKNALAGIIDPAVIQERIRSVLRIDVRAELARLSQPLLFLRATRDRLIRRKSTVTIRSLKPSAEIVDVEAPHLLLQANPTDAWKHIEHFLERAPRA